MLNYKISYTTFILSVDNTPQISAERQCAILDDTQRRVFVKMALGVLLGCQHITEHKDHVTL